jgi:glycosyltransferase involved in cell wall biosynthesis
MRILLATHLYPPDGIAGVERITQWLAAQLVRMGDTVSIVTRRDGDAPSAPRMVRERQRDGAAVYRFDGGERPMDRFLLHHERLEDLFTTVLLEEVPDVVHLNHLFGLSPRFIEIAHRHRAAVIVTLHDFFFACPLVQLLKQPSGDVCDGPDGGRECARSCFAHQGADANLRWGLRAAYFRRLLGTAERVISPSRYMGSFFERFGVDPGRLHIFPNGIPFDPAEGANPDRPTPVQKGALDLVFFGTVVPHKGPHVILEALRIARLGSVTLTLLGQVPSQHRVYGQDLREQAAHIPGLKFRMYGTYQPHELRCLLQEMDCAIVPSQWPETFGLVTQEALVRGIPLLASRLGGLPEIVAEGENGFTFEYNRPEELAAILRRLAEDDDLVRRLRAGARRSPVLTMAQHTGAVRTVYQSALEDFAGHGRADEGAAEELAFLHAALLNLGVGEIN